VGCAVILIGFIITMGVATGSDTGLAFVIIGFVVVFGISLDHTARRRREMGAEAWGQLTFMQKYGGKGGTAQRRSHPPCPWCGEPAPLSDRFCSHCGGDLSDDEEHEDAPATP